MRPGVAAAACCVTHDVPLATLNLKDYEDFRRYHGLRILGVDQADPANPRDAAERPSESSPSSAGGAPPILLLITDFIRNT